ncbi:protease pro-enzyme activation domain-containing protein [Acidicapsa acidisoli]|uniref:protease pro-enzyme activation domain-containing protein n=1 Tax=Acidicapsa acidisoli TaxID=1615681 RepID=UPI0021DF875D|nr:protease pro-enzyme activation domain-containing protein [Acidicapsa acidisoli]
MRTSLGHISFLLVRTICAAVALAASLRGAGALQAQAVDRLPEAIDSAKLVALPRHHPQWANAANSIGALSASQPIDGLTIVLSRSPEKELAFEKLLAAQQDPASPEYHHWLTAAEVGQRFGLSEHDLAAVSAWLQSQGLHVSFVAPSRIFLGFGGTVEQLNHAFHTELQSYNVHGTERISVASDPMLPASLAPVVKAIRGLYTIDDRPFHSAKSMHMARPDLTLENGNHFVTPADFATIYDLPGGGTGAGQTIGIVGVSRTDPADFEEFRGLTGTSFPNPIEIVPTAFGGIDPGPAYTAPPPSGTSIDGQLEATLDVTRAGSIANGGQLELVVATASSGGIGDDAQYLVQTTPLPAQVMSISFGACESEGGSSGVKFWDTLFQQAASEGMSVFVSSGDAGASGCDANFGTPPTDPSPNSPNYICSSSYATCVGGTEFNDTGDPSEYWGTTNSGVLESALSYIPEGAWNQPLNEDSEPQAASSGGGVSSFVATPSWQTGTGVPSARAGRYTPDVAFSASGHDGYFGCFAAAGSSCVPNSEGEFEFEYFYGTSAAAPAMAAIAALLDENAGFGQGNLNPQLYSLASSAPSVFHDVTVATSGVSGCTVDTPSMCNNSIPGPTGLTGGQAGYLIGDGYDEVTGLGSLDISNFLNSYPVSETTPTVSLDFGASGFTTAQPIYGSVTLTGRAGKTPTGSVILSGGGYESSSATLSNGYAYFTIPADTLPIGNNVMTASYTPDATDAGIYNTATGSDSITVTSVPLITPSVSVFIGTPNITTAQSLLVEVSISGGINNAVPTGSVTLVSGSYKSAPVAAGSSGITFIQVPAQALAAGTDTLKVTYTPDKASAGIYASATGSTTESVTAATIIAPTVTVLPASSSITTAQNLAVIVYVQTNEGPTYQAPTGTVTLTGGTFTSAPVAPSQTSANFTIPSESLAVGNDTLTASYTPDSGSSALYSSSTGSASVTVAAAPPPSFSITGSAVSVTPGATSGNTSTVTVTPAGGFTGTVALTAAITASPANTTNSPTVSFGSTGSVAISGTGIGTAALTVTTAARGGCTQANERASGADPWLAAGGAAMAGVLLLGFPASKRWRLFAMLLFLGALTSVVTACGGGGGGAGGSSCQVVIPGTTAGTYTITVTGTSGSTTNTGTVTLTVQ